MSRVVLVEAAPWSAADGAPVAVRLAGGGTRAYTHRGFNDWRAGVVGIPRFNAQLGFGQDGWTGGAIPTTGAITFAPSDPALLTSLASRMWAGAPIEIRTGDDSLAEPVWTLELKGVVAGAVVRGGVLSVTVSDLSGDLAKPAIEARFAGTGGIEGIAEAKDRIKRRSWGRCWGVEGRLLDKANNIYEFGDPAFPLQAFDAVKDRGRAGATTLVPWAGSVAATFNALKAATAPQGGAAIAPSIACVKWWTVPAAPLTADIRGEVGAGYVETAPQIAARIVAARSALVVSNAAAMAAARPGAAGIHADSEGETAAQLLDRLLLRVSLIWIVDADGTIRLSPIGYDAPIEELVATEIEREATFKPVTEVLLGYQRNHRRHSDAEISAAFQASDGTYADGTPIEDLKPAQPGATQGAVVGNGPGAPGNVVDSGGNPLERADLLNYLEEPTGTTIVQPGGGYLSTNGGLATGALKIRLPLGASSTMLRFQVDVFDYVAGGTQIYFIQGYTYDQGGVQTWHQVDARLVGGSGSARPVRFGHDGAKMCIWIGDPGTEWWYPKFAIRGVQASYANFSAAQWKSGWVLSLDTAAATNVSGQVLKPVAGDSSFGENLRETFGGALATIPNFKTIFGISAGIVDQGTGATANSLAQLNAADAAALAGVVSAVGSITSDSVIATSEKMGLIQAWKQTNALWLEQNAISISLNGTYGGDPTGVYRGNASAAVSALINYLESLSPGWADPFVNTPVDGDNLRNLFTAATNTISALGEANGYQLSTRSTWGSVGGRPTELTDGRVATGLDALGVLRTGLFGGADAVSVSEIISASAMSGTQLAINPEFALPLVAGNGVYLYDNSGGGKVGLTRISGAAAPNSSKMMLVINYDGTGVEGHSVIGPSPGFGGFTLQLVPAAVGEVSRPGFYARNSRILFKVVADIPVGRALGWATNAVGDGAAIKYVTSMFGTGEFKEYIFELKVGATGTFSSTAYFYVFGGPNAAFSWSVAKADAIDVTGAPRVTMGQGLRDENGVARGGNEVVTAKGIALAVENQDWGATADRKALDNNYVQTVLIKPWGASVSGNTITRASGDTDYNAAAYADRINGPCYVSLFIASDVWNMVSLDGDLADRAYSAMSATVHYHPTVNGGTCNLYVFGVLISNITGVGNWSGTELQLVYDGSFFRVMLGGDNPTSHAAPANLALYPVWHAYNAGVRFYNLRSGPAKSAARIGSNTFDGSGNLKGGPDLITIDGVAGALYNQGPGATALAADVLNYHEAGGVTTIRRPGGGVYAFNGGAIYGAIKIALPVSNSHTMIRFFVDIFDYQVGGMVTYAVSGYPFSNSGTPAWNEVSAQVNGRAAFSRPVKFGWDGAKSCVWIGEPSSYWSYPQVVIRDFQAGYNGQLAASWNTGWVVSMDPGPPALVSNLVARPVAGDAIMGENVLEAPGIPATNANYKTNQGIAIAVENQGRGAVSNTLTDLNPTEGVKLAGIETAADVTSAITGPADIVIKCDHLGSPLDGQLPKVGAFRLNRNGTDVTTAATWSRTVLSGAMTSTIGSATGQLSVSAFTADGSLRITAVYGATTRTFEVRVIKELAAPPNTGGGGGGGGSTATDTSLASVSTTSMVAVSDELTVTVGSAGKVDLTVTTQFEFVLSSPGEFDTRYIFAVFQYWNGSAWVDVETELPDNNPYTSSRDNSTGYYWTTPGYLSFTKAQTGLTAGSTRKYRLRARTGQSGGEACYFMDSVVQAAGS